MSDRPLAADVMMEFGANEVELVPPLAIERVPEMFARVVVVCQVGTPLTKAKTKPFVPADVVASLSELLPRRRVFAWMFDQPVPPTLAARVEEADQTPEFMTATPVSPDESIPVPPFAAAIVPPKDESDKQFEPIA